ncbi:helix-turn-helix domain-containing protein [Ramlibacter sp.]|uniref:helix-turn-helix domain-containing protein n=1 Tax=Ramlibacter sp. TaxID=1917967 RepID=UPI00345DEA9D
MLQLRRRPAVRPGRRLRRQLDLTGIDAPERPELKHLAAQSARSIENAPTLARPHRLVPRLNWPGRLRRDDDDGLVCLDGDGWVDASNIAARAMVAELAANPGAPLHCSELFARPREPLFDHARLADAVPQERPLGSGLRLDALPQTQGETLAGGAARKPLRDVEIALIRKAVAQARGNAMEASRRLGISRATICRKLSLKASKNGRVARGPT